MTFAARDGYHYERMLASTVSDSVLSEFVHLNPQCTGPSESERELCDILIEDGVNCIPVQLKSSQTEDWPKTDKAHRWIRKKLKEAADQCKGAASSIQKRTVKSVHPVRGVVEYLPTELKCLHTVALVTCNGVGFELDESVDTKCLQMCAIHYFDYRDFQGICRATGTVPDMMAYLDARAEVSIEGLPALGGERDLYAYYLLNAGRLENVSRSDYSGLWTKLKFEQSNLYVEMLNGIKQSLPFKQVLTECRKSLPQLSNWGQTLLKTPSASAHQKTKFNIARELNTFRQFHRRTISNNIVQCMKIADTHENGFSFFAYKRAANQSGIVFLSSRARREIRQNMIGNLCHLACAGLGLNTMVGIATDNMSCARGHSYDFCRYTIDQNVKFSQQDFQAFNYLFGEIELESVGAFPSYDVRIPVTLTR